jgi:PAS domain S-box-containing protein
MNHQPNIDNSTVALSSEADYFRQLIEKQPAVLMRLGLDGALMAANHAALGLLGAEHLDQLIGLTLTTCVAPEHRNRWTEFSAAIGNGISNSFECDFTNLVGTSRSIVFHGVPLMDNRDGVASVILSAHDMSTLRWSEAVFENADLQRRDPVEPPERVETQHGRLEQLERLLRDGRNHLLDLRTKRERENAEARSLAAQLAEREASLQRSVTAHAALSEALSAKERQNADLAAALAEHEHSAAEGARERLETEQRTRDQLTKLTAERDELTELLDTREHELETAAEKQESLEERLQSALSEHTRLDALLNDRAERLETVEAARNIVTNERDDLHARLETTACEHRKLSAQLEEAATGRQRAEDALADVRLELDRLDAGTRQLLPLVSAGRLALEISGDLTVILAAIDARVASLLAGSPRESSARQDLQLLSADVFTASLLSREILLSSDRGSARSAEARPHDDATT